MSTGGKPPTKPVWIDILVAVITAVATLGAAVVVTRKPLPTMPATTVDHIESNHTDGGRFANYGFALQATDINPSGTQDIATVTLSDFYNGLPQLPPMNFQHVNQSADFQVNDRNFLVFLNELDHAYCR